MKRKIINNVSNSIVEKRGKSVLHQWCQDFRLAKDFVLKTHENDLIRLRKRCRTGLVEDFDEFFDEYCYVVVASGFRALHAARLAPRLVECKGNEEEMLKVFKNRAKVKALSDLHSRRSEWPALRASFKQASDLMALPRIGPIVQHHLARNIGLVTDRAKPDLHMIRYHQKTTARKIESQADDVQAMVESIAAVEKEPVGVTDFILWCWLSHDSGATENKCCHGGFLLR